MNSYQKEQLEALTMVRQYISTLSVSDVEKLTSEISDYLSFRDEVDDFLHECFGRICTQKCHQDKVSACCARESIITFFGDMVINVLISKDHEIRMLISVLKNPNQGFKCIYLGDQGCLWRVKPIVCEMFLCKQAKKDIFKEKPRAEEAWNEFKRREKLFTWPNRPILFDNLERYFIDAGYDSPLIYLHKSPGLVRVKKLSGIAPL